MFMNRVLENDHGGNLCFGGERIQFFSICDLEVFTFAQISLIRINI